MIERFEIDATRGSPNQVGLFVFAAVGMVEQFAHNLRQAGFLVRFMPSRRGGYSHFSYISTPDRNSAPEAIKQLLLPECQKYVTATPANATVSYADWQTAFNQYVRQYGALRFASSTTTTTTKFDKALTYRLIQENRFEETEAYLRRFTMDAPSGLVLAYWIALYAAWAKPAKIIEIYGRYQAIFRASDIDRRVAEWVVDAYLRVTPPQPEAAIAVLDDYLPDFQRQGLAEPLLALRAQARALLGHIPQTIPELRAFIAHSPKDILVGQLSPLLETLTGLVAPRGEIFDLLTTLEAVLPSDLRWRVIVARSLAARQANQPGEALRYLQNLFQNLPPTLTQTEVAGLRLNAAYLAKQAEKMDEARQWLADISAEQLGVADERGYWELRGQLNLQAGDAEAALIALTRAYELGHRATGILQSLAQLAYQANDHALAAQVYRELLATGFEPSLTDHLRAGVLAWLADDWHKALIHLRVGLRDSQLERRTVEPLAYLAWVKSLLATRTGGDEVVEAFHEWLDALFAQQQFTEVKGYLALLIEARLGRATQFALLEPLETITTIIPDLGIQLAAHYERLFCEEIENCLRQVHSLPEYVTNLRRGLFILDRARFEFLQEYLGDELHRAQAADLVPTDFTLETPTSALNLRTRWVALVGGYEQVRKRVREHLEQDFHLGRFTEVPPSWEAHIDQHWVAEAVLGADLIVVMHRCIKHDGTDALKAALTGTQFEGRVRYAPGKGHSSVIQTVQQFFIA